MHEKIKCHICNDMFMGLPGEEDTCQKCLVENITVAGQIDKLLQDYDLVDTDNECLNNISGALLDMYLWTLNRPLAKLPA